MQRLPVVFVGHGSPMTAVEENPFSPQWSAAARNIPRPEAILCVSAHWLTEGSFAATTARPEAIHDFWGFPQALYDVTYPAPGSPETAEAAMRAVKSAAVAPDPEWGLDHGAWCVLRAMYPEADIPVCQLSIDMHAAPEAHHAIGRELAPLRDDGVLILCSGNIVHNLGMLRRSEPPFDWAVEFDAAVRGAVERRADQELFDPAAFGKAGKLSVPTSEHYWPLLYALGAAAYGEKPRWFAEGFDLSSLSMRSAVFA